MKLKYFKVTFFVFLCFSFSMMGQTFQEKEEIIKNYDLSKLNSLKEKYSKRFNLEKNKAVKLAQQNGWQIKFTEDGSDYELKRISKEGIPIYYKTDNVDAAITTRANFMHNGGGLGLDIEGQGMTAHVWDGGLARATHQEYDGAGGLNRYSVGDDSSALSFHGAHVTGTIMSSGFVSAAKGMAPQSKVVGHDWNDDLAEATAAAAAGMLISNHSYGYRAADVPDWWFGAYTNDAREWDNLLYNAPYYLKVVSAGNDGNDSASNAEPLDGNNQYDKLSGDKTSKNSLIIANSQDAAINVDGTLSSVSRNSSSSEGPTDDLRVKPDLMGNGTGLFSSYETTDSAYNSISGTSMASPNVAGSLLLLQQYYKDITGSFMKAATLKGLALHTADDNDIVGPDANTGWGLLNIKAAAETVTNNGLATWVAEETLSNGGSYSITVKSDGLSPLLASISWTDKAGVANTGTANDPTSALVNDLDIRITQTATTYNPWKLTGVDTNGKGDNTVDPFERVDITGASGDYEITVTHKGTLDEDQNFSLVISGVTSDFTFNTSNTSQTVCSGGSNEAIYDFSYVQTGSSSTSFSANGVPSGANLVFSSATLNVDTTLNVTLQNIDNVAAGEYIIEIIGDNGDEIEKRNIMLKVLHPDFSNNVQVISAPVNGLSGISSGSLSLNWLENLNAESYLVEVSTTPSFSSLLTSSSEVGLSFRLNNLAGNTVYYWRVKPNNNCAEGIFSETFSFQTGLIECNNFSATNFTNASIGASDVDVTAYVPIAVNIAGNSIINSITITTDISHSRISDLVIFLQEPVALGSSNIALLTDPCGSSFADISNTTFDDGGIVYTCAGSSPAISGTIAPEDNLSSTAGKDANGTWFLAMTDQVRFQGGQINSATLNVCTSAVNTNIPAFSSSEIQLAGSTSYTITSTNMNASTATETDAQQVFTLVQMPTKGLIENDGTALNIGDTFTQADVVSNKVVFVNSQGTLFTDQFKVDITNAAGGWLPNQVINIVENTLKVDQFILNNISLWPNPTKGILNIKLMNSSDNNVIISLFDLQGRKVRGFNDASSNSIFTKEIDTKNISSGIYLLSISQGNKKATKKIIISK
jgi:subtilisin-like proprotein convertase family protein